jgi:hypothetical protein
MVAHVSRERFDERRGTPRRHAGGGTAGLYVVGRLGRADDGAGAITDRVDRHYYQLLRTLVRQAARLQPVRKSSETS